MQNYNDKTFEYNRKSIGKILSELEDGRIKIPFFQRDYDWKIEEILDLLNSINSNDPIGNIVLWQTKDIFSINNNIIDEISSKEKYNEYLYLIDGQQRLTSIFTLFNFNKLKNKKHIENFKKIVFNMETNIFEKYESKKEYKNKTKYFINEIFSLKEDDIKNNIVERGFKNEEIYKIKEIIIKINDRFLDLEIGVLQLNNYDLDNVIDVFEKINTKGKKLSIFDIVKAKWIKSDININEIFSKLTKSLNEFVILDDKKKRGIWFETLLDSLFLVIETKPILKAKEKIQLNINNEEEKKEIIKKWEKSTKNAMKFLNDELNFSFNTVPSANIIKWCIYFFFKRDEKRDDIGNKNNIIKKYIALLCINHSYGKGTIGVLEQNIKFIDSLILNDNEKINEYIKKFTIPYIKDEYFINDLKDSSKQDMVAKLINSILLRNKDFLSGTKIKSNFDLHHIFPKKGYGNEYREEDLKDIINSYANITPINKITNNDIKNKKFSFYFDNYKKNTNNNLDEILVDHGINPDLWKQDDSIDNMLKAVKDRSKELAKKINQEFNLK
ncbi:MAG: GmrSD restriction endonuclease domain-containing protein [Metamycoplasmataceae bacterium]